MKDAVLKTKGADNLHTVNMKGDYAVKQDHQPGKQQDSFHPPEDILELHRVSTDVQGVIETKHEAVKQREDITGLNGVLTEFDVNGLIQQKQDKHTMVRFISIVCIHYN